MTTANDKVTLPGGGVLRGDAAGSYLRMLADGLPAGGVAVFSRSLAKQKELFKRFKEGKGPVAARPSPNAPHIKGVALDLQTAGPNKTYRPSKAHVWLTTGGDGSRPPAAGEKLRAHKYGWFRTVRTERWHFGYHPGKDSKRAADLEKRLAKLGYADLKEFQRAHSLVDDGKDGPRTWAALLNKPKPANGGGGQPPPTEPGEVLFRLGQVNLRAARFGGLPDDSPARGEFLRTTLACSMYALSEVSETARDAIRAALGDAWKVFPEGYCTVLWDSRKWQHTGRDSVSFGTDVHGAVRAELIGRNGQAIDVIALHVRSRASFAPDADVAAGKQADIVRALTLLRAGVPTIVAGDFNTGRTAETLTKAGLVRATGARDSFAAEGTQAVDQVWVSPHLAVRRATMIDPGDLTDHQAWMVRLTLPGPG